MKTVNLIYKKRKIKVDFYQSKRGKVTIKKITMVETGEDITNYLDSNNKNRICNMIKIGEAEWI